MTATLISQDIRSIPGDGQPIGSAGRVIDDLVLTVRRSMVNGEDSPEADGVWVGRLRRVCAAWLGRGCGAATVGDAQLLLSELVTNALRLPGGRAEVGR